MFEKIGSTFSILAHDFTTTAFDCKLTDTDLRVTGPELVFLLRIKLDSLEAFANLAGVKGACNL